MRMAGTRVQRPILRRLEFIVIEPASRQGAAKEPGDPDEKGAEQESAPEAPAFRRTFGAFAHAEQRGADKSPDGGDRAEPFMDAINRAEATAFGNGELHKPSERGGRNAAQRTEDDEESD